MQWCLQGHIVELLLRTIWLKTCLASGCCLRVSHQPSLGFWLSPAAQWTLKGQVHLGPAQGLAFVTSYGNSFCGQHNTKRKRCGSVKLNMASDRKLNEIGPAIFRNGAELTASYYIHSEVIGKSFGNFQLHAWYSWEWITPELPIQWGKSEIIKMSFA